MGSVAFFVPFFPPLEARSCEPTGCYIGSGTFDADGMMAATTMPPASTRLPGARPPAVLPEWGCRAIMSCTVQSKVRRYCMVQPQAGFRLGGHRLLRRMGTVASEVERRQDWVAKPSGEAEAEEDDDHLMYRLRVPALRGLRMTCIGDDPPQRCSCRLALPRVSIQPGVAYCDLHFLGCPFSPGLLTGDGWCTLTIRFCS